MGHQREIEFLGGPFDGHRVSISERPPELGETLRVPVSQDMLSLLGRRHKVRGVRAPITSVAVYQLQKGKERWCYHYAESRRPVESST